MVYHKAQLCLPYYSTFIQQMSRLTLTYADDIALGVQDECIENAGNTLESDRHTVNKYFKKLGPQPNPTIAEVSAFNLNNEKANYRLNIKCEGTTIKHHPNPKYIDVTLDRTQHFKTHLQNTAVKIKTRNNIMNAEVIRTSGLALVYSVAKYCAHVWLNIVTTYIL